MRRAGPIGAGFSFPESSGKRPAVVLGLADLSSGFGEVISFQQVGRRRLEIQLSLNRFAGQQGVDRERDDAPQQTPCNPHGKGPVLEIADSLIVPPALPRQITDSDLGANRLIIGECD